MLRHALSVKQDDPTAPWMDTAGTREKIMSYSFCYRPSPAWAEKKNYPASPQWMICFQMDEYHDRMEDFPEEDEDANSDDDDDDGNRGAPHSLKKMALNQHQGKGFKMEVMEY